MSKPNVTLDSINQTIDLEELTGIDLSDFRGIREAIGQAIIDKIKARTEDGQGYGGTRLHAPYSRTYQNTLEFKAAGKSARDVNMTLTGDMLAGMDVQAGEGDSRVQVFLSSDQVGKAYNHIKGVTVPRRNWFGVDSREIKSILKDFHDDLVAAQEANESVDDRASGRRDTIKAIDILKEAGQDDGEEDDF